MSRGVGNTGTSAVDIAKLTERSPGLEQQGMGDREVRTRSCGSLELLGERAKQGEAREACASSVISVAKPHFSCRPSQQTPASGPQPHP